MNIRSNEPDLRRCALEIETLENEGGPTVPDTPDHQYYGRRIEADRSWTVYHVFTGIPARFGAKAGDDRPQPVGSNRQPVVPQSSPRGTRGRTVHAAGICAERS